VKYSISFANGIVHTLQSKRKKSGGNADGENTGKMSIGLDCCPALPQQKLWYPKQHGARGKTHHHRRLRVSWKGNTLELKLLPGAGSKGPSQRAAEVDGSTTGRVCKASLDLLPRRPYCVRGGRKLARNTTTLEGCPAAGKEWGENCRGTRTPANRTTWGARK